MDQLETLQRQEFVSILKDMAQSENLLADHLKRTEICDRLKKLYRVEDGEIQFRHFYSDIFSVLVDLKKGSSLGSIDVLGQNMAFFRDLDVWNCIDEKTQESVSIKQSINKLYDHLNLDIGRMRYIDDLYKGLSQDTEIKGITNRVDIEIKRIDDLSARVDESFEKSEHVLAKSEEAISKSGEATMNAATAVSRSEEAASKADAATSKAENSEKEYIAILGIFSAVALTFTGGMSFAGSALQNIENSDPYKIAFIVLLVGVVLINALFGMFYYIDKLVHKKPKLHMCL